MLNRLLVIGILGGLLPLGAELSWLLELSSHFRLQYLAVALPLLLIAILRRRRVLAGLLGAMMLVNAWPLLPYMPTPGRADSAAAGQPALSILNLNVNSANADHEGILAAVIAAETDIVALIELSPALDEALAAISAAYPYRFTLPGTGNFGLGLLSRYPIAYAEPRALGPTRAIVADIDHPAGRFRFLAVHSLPPMSATKAAARNAQLAELALLVQGMAGPLVVCGDFNLTPYSPWFGRFESGSGLRDVRRGRWPGISWPSFLPLAGIPIDHCFTRPPFVAAAVERLEPVGSDHYPVRVRLERLQD